jgi:hypothetical protein
VIFVTGVDLDPLAFGQLSEMDGVILSVSLLELFGGKIDPEAVCPPLFC